MFILSLQMVHICNLNCSYCYLGQKNGKKLSMEIIDRALIIAINEAKKQKDKTLETYFIGGEPLLAFEEIKKVVPQICTLCDQNNLKATFSITTNATLLTKEIMDFMIQYHFDVKVSMDGDRKSHDLNRTYYSGEGSFQTIIDRLSLKDDYEQRTGKSMHVAQVVTPNNVGYLFENFKFLHEDLDFQFIETEMNGYVKWSKEDKQVLYEQIRKTMLYYMKKIQAEPYFIWDLMSRLAKNYINDVSFYNCRVAVHSLFVNVNGVYYSCQECSGMELGSCKENDLRVDKIREMISIKETRNTECLNCKYLKHCSVRGCIVENYNINNDIYKPVEISCYVTKVFMKLFDELYSSESANKDKEDEAC